MLSLLFIEIHIIKQSKTILIKSTLVYLLKSQNIIASFLKLKTELKIKQGKHHLENSFAFAESLFPVLWRKKIFWKIILRISDMNAAFSVFPPCACPDLVHFLSYYLQLHCLFLIYCCYTRVYAHAYINRAFCIHLVLFICICFRDDHLGLVKLLEAWQG